MFQQHIEDGRQVEKPMLAKKALGNFYVLQNVMLFVSVDIFILKETLYLGALGRNCRNLAYDQMILGMPIMCLLGIALWSVYAGDST